MNLKCFKESMKNQYRMYLHEPFDLFGYLFHNVKNLKYKSDLFLNRNAYVYLSTKSKHLNRPLDNLLKIIIDSVL